MLLFVNFYYCAWGYIGGINLKKYFNKIALDFNRHFGLGVVLGVLCSHVFRVDLTQISFPFSFNYKNINER